MNILGMNIMLMNVPTQKKNGKPMQVSDNISNNFINFTASIGSTNSSYETILENTILMIKLMN